MEMAEEAFKGLWPEKDLNYEFRINYSGKFKGYNANIRLQSRSITFSLSKNWRSISRDIKIGLLQGLLARLFKEKNSTPHIDLYHIFLKKVHIAVPKTKTNPVLEESFNRINDDFFAGMMEKPNLEWCNSAAKFGSYEYGSDAITISSLLKHAGNEMLDYVMYHEMLHKKHKFTSKKGRTYHHTKEFRLSEKSFPNSAQIEEKLKLLGSRRPKKKGFRFNFLRFF